MQETYIHPLISSLICLKIIKFYVLIQEWEDKTELLLSFLSTLNISKLVDVICFSWISNFIALIFFS